MSGSVARRAGQALSGVARWRSEAGQRGSERRRHAEANGGAGRSGRAGVGRAGRGGAGWSHGACRSEAAGQRRRPERRATPQKQRRRWASARGHASAWAGRKDIEGSWGFFLSVNFRQLGPSLPKIILFLAANAIIAENNHMFGGLRKPSKLRFNFGGYHLAAENERCDCEPLIKSLCFLCLLLLWLLENYLFACLHFCQVYF